MEGHNRYRSGHCTFSVCSGWKIDYVTSLGVYRYFVVDGYDMIGYYYNTRQDQFEKPEELPHYPEMLNV